MPGRRNMTTLRLASAAVPAVSCGLVDEGGAPLTAPTLATGESRQHVGRATGWVRRTSKWL